MSEMVRVFVDARGIDVPAGSTALEAVRLADAALADDVEHDLRVITDSRGLPVEGNPPVTSGSIFRVIARRARTTSDDG
jgi:hypothetical protein